VDESELMTSLFQWVRRTFSDVKVIWDNQGEARPPKPYVLLSLTSGPTKRGYDDQSVLNDNKTEYSGAREIMMSVNYLGSGALIELSRLQTEIEFDSGIDFLLDRGLSVVRDGGIRDLTKALENSFESRAQMDVTLTYVAAAKDENSTVITEVEIQNEIDDTSSVIDAN
jgi:hypothetical protein